MKAELAYKVAHRLTKVARRHLAERETESECYDPDDETAARDHCLGVAIRPPVRPSSTLPLGEPFGAGPNRKPLCASVSGFSLHAATRVAADDRDGLERLLRYGLRAPFSHKRIAPSTARACRRPPRPELSPPPPSRPGPPPKRVPHSSRSP